MTGAGRESGRRFLSRGVNLPPSFIRRGPACEDASSTEPYHLRTDDEAHQRVGKPPIVLGGNIDWADRLG